MKTVLDSLIHTLNQVEVRGKENLDMLLGCIQTLEKLRDCVKVEKKKIVDGGAEDDDHNRQREDGNG